MLSAITTCYEQPFTSAINRMKRSKKGFIRAPIRTFNATLE